ncbi:hypothetical protein SAMN05216215_100741 [Saccharopolyspora shandongensis]|uniref:Uncharacterized protein n=1 Tax=Saccharopolyspora shandongensis TaxID=418495 RepID=A0A1H2YJF1_9PSEU|nr:hypothetical protein SAMN05216215_100741 [Saccharopolyspora shandongensis]
MITARGTTTAHGRCALGQLQPCNGKEVSAGVDQKGILLDHAGTSKCCIQACVELLHTSNVKSGPCGTLHPIHRNVLYSSGVQLVSKFISCVEVRRDETEVAVIAAGRDDGFNRRTHLSSEPTGGPGLQDREIAADGGGEQHASWAEHTPGFGQRLRTVIAIDQVIERTEEQHDIRGVIGAGQVAGIAELRSDTRDRGRRFHMTGHRIDNVHRVAFSSQPAGMNSGPATDIEHSHPRPGHGPTHQLLGA